MQVYFLTTTLVQSILAAQKYTASNSTDDKRLIIHAQSLSVCAGMHAFPSSPTLLAVFVRMYVSNPLRCIIMFVGLGTG